MFHAHRNLNQPLSQGLILTELEFSQEALLKPYIEFSIDQRKNVKKLFPKKFFDVDK